MRSTRSVRWPWIVSVGAQWNKSTRRHRSHGVVLIWLLLIYFGAAAPAVFAQSERERELERKLDEALRIIQQLVPRLERLEKQSSQQQAGAPAQPHQVAAPAHQTVTAAQPAVAHSGLRLPIIDTPLHGFVDVGGVAGSDRKGQRRGFTVGSFDLFLTPELGDRVKALVETVFEVDNGGDLAVDLERAQLGYVFGDYLTAWLGRFHTPYGYWNTGFHHGHQISTSVRRPQFIDFEDKGGILPAHTVGVWGTGNFRLGSGKLNYDLFVGNAPTLRDGELNPKMAGLKRFTPSYGGNLAYDFRGALDGLKLGLHWLRGDVQNVDDKSRADLNALGPYLVYNADPWEVIAELYRFDNKDITGDTGRHGSWSAFAQAGHQFDRWTPYGRFEWANLNQRDPYFRAMESGRSYSRGAFGVRYDLSPKAAIKLEYRHTVNKNLAGPQSSGDAAELQFSVRF